MTELKKLHLACGTDYLEGYENVDLYPQEGAKVDASYDVTTIPYPDNSIDEIRALHIIEHFDWFQIHNVLREWHRVLKPGGRLVLETPDFLESCKLFTVCDEPTRWLLYGHFFATPWVPGQTHKFLFTEYQLAVTLGNIGFKNVTRIPPMSNYVPSYPSPNLFLAVETFK